MTIEAKDIELTKVVSLGASNMAICGVAEAGSSWSASATINSGFILMTSQAGDIQKLV